MTRNNINILEHRKDLADIIINKSRNIKQDKAVFLIYGFFFPKAIAYQLALILMLISSFFFGFKKASDQYYQENISQKSIVEKIYYSNFVSL
jgi:hypothetical protein